MPHSDTLAMQDDLAHIVTRAISLHKWSIGKLVSVFEDTRPHAASKRMQVLAMLRANSTRRTCCVGITGTPGAGKSTLVGELATRLIARDKNYAVAVLAIDPSSHVSGGALLGDRTRVRFAPSEQRLYFRSQASDLDLGGVSRNTFQVYRLLSYLFDVVFVETVGIGQSEVEIQQVADVTYLVMQPMAGDQIQFMKAGIMEIPDAFILNKSDQHKAAERSYHALHAALGLARLATADGPAIKLPIYRTSATTGAGIDTVIEDITARMAAPIPVASAKKTAHFFEKWVRDQYGRHGIHALRRIATHVPAYITDCGGFDEAQLAFSRQFNHTHPQSKT